MSRGGYAFGDGDAPARRLARGREALVDDVRTGVITWRVRQAVLRQASR